MAIERFMEILGPPKSPNHLKPLVAPLKPSEPKPVSKPEVQSKKRDDKLEKAIKEAGDKVSRVEKSIGDLQRHTEQSSTDVRATATRLSGIEAELRGIQDVRQELTEYQGQVEEYIALAAREQCLCPNCRHDVDWPNLPLQEGMFSWLLGNMYRTCPDCGHQIRVRKEE